MKANKYDWFFMSIIIIAVILIFLGIILFVINNSVVYATYGGVGL